MSRYFSIDFNDLSFEKRQELISEIKNDLLEQWEREVDNYTKNPEYKGKSWQEIYCRVYDIDYKMWEEEADAKTFDWSFAVEEHADKEAEEKCSQAMHNLLELEVEI